MELIPVLELPPFEFTTSERDSPCGSCREEPEAWKHYWSACLADSEIRGLAPLRSGSWNVPVRNIDGPNLRRILALTFEKWGGLETLRDPACSPLLSGGLALRSDGNIMVEPNCCADLRNWEDWVEAANYQGTDWQMLWIGHPWLSVRYEEAWLIISDAHESDRPTPRWRVAPEQLSRAVAGAIVELEGFAQAIGPQLAELGCADVPNLARHLAGFVN
ncbi:MAG TPA: hypothetical protein VHB77_09690 [Planctomycetaceae bacterium]|nr:hypothetical protein [Planctomycetaceae bacterium]